MNNVQPLCSRAQPCLAQVVLSYFVGYCIEARYLWCLRPKLHICAAYCSDSQMELIV